MLSLLIYKSVSLNRVLSLLVSLFEQGAGYCPGFFLLVAKGKVRWDRFHCPFYKSVSLNKVAYGPFLSEKKTKTEMTAIVQENKSKHTMNAF